MALATPPSPPACRQAGTETAAQWSACGERERSGATRLEVGERGEYGKE
jgi:hypothetical protein